jgi:zinc protease
MIALAATCAILLAAGRLSALPDPLQSAYRYRLDNGLELVGRQNVSLPLVLIQATFRCGAMAQTKDNAGIFRVFTDLVASGQVWEGGPDAFAVSLAAMGAAWEHETLEEYLFFRLTLPSKRLPEGMAFMSRVLMSPVFSEQGLAPARARAAAQASAALENPSAVLQAGILSRIFSSYPFRRDVMGSPTALNAVNQSGLLAIQAKYIIPNNCLLTVSGDCTAGEALASVKEAFGPWEAGPDPWKAAPTAHPIPPFKRSAWLIFEDPGLEEGRGSVEIHYRGPDLGGDPKAPTTDPKGAMAASILCRMVAQPSGRFTSGLAKAVPGLDPASAIASFAPSRDGGALSFSVSFILQTAGAAWETAMIRYKEQVRGVELEAARRDPLAYFGKGSIEAAAESLAAERALDFESLAGFVSGVAREWAAASSDYCFGLPASLQAVNAEDIRAFIFKYVNKNLEAVLLRLSPTDYAREAKPALEHGFTVLNADNAFWWKPKK